MKINFCLLLSLLLFGAGANAQMSNYTYKRELNGISEQWHSISLPDEIFGKLKNNLHDIRIYGITPGNDTLEAPFLLTVKDEKIIEKEIAFNLLNSVKNATGYYYTFSLPEATVVNKLLLNFSEENFDLKITLEGSNDQNNWFTVAENYRILSINNNHTTFKYTNVLFNDITYKYIRLTIPGNTNPGFTSAKIIKKIITEGIEKKYPVKALNIHQNSQLKQTEINLLLKHTFPVDKIKINVTDQIDYYRPVSIQTATDSTHTEKGVVYHYHTISNAVLNSIENNHFKFNSILTNRLRIIISNFDNVVLNTDSIEVLGSEHTLTARFSEPADYYLVYSNAGAFKPNYDIAYFKENIPAVITTLSTGEEQTIEKKAGKSISPLFENQLWLWLIMAVIIIVLGWFSLQMIRKTH